MGYDYPDMYHQPEKFGLEILGVLSDPAEYYDFDWFVVWKHEDGRIFYGEDQGCSCPSPFETFTSLERANEVTSVEEFEGSVIEYYNSLDYLGTDLWNSDNLSPKFQILRTDAVNLINTVYRLLNN